MEYGMENAKDYEARELIDRLFETGTLGREEFLALLSALPPTGAPSLPSRRPVPAPASRPAPAADSLSSCLFEKARIRQRENFGNSVYLRGLIEFSNYCRNDCLYCGLRRSSRSCDRYRLTEEEILDCCEKGHELDFRTFVLQSGEDPARSDDDICRIVSRIRERHPDCAVTLSIGEKSRESYRRYRDAGAERYLLRHETADPGHYARLHPPELSLENRIRCLYDLKELGYQVGAGMMVQAPYQTADHLVTDLLFLKELQPQMIGIGPFIPHQDTPFRGFPAGSVTLTLQLIAILRLMFPQGLIPATTALGTADPLGREKGILAGANVVMPNLSPPAVRGKYLLYDGKICTGDEAAECRYCMQTRMQSIGYEVKVSRGDAPGFAPPSPGDSSFPFPPFRL